MVGVFFDDALEAVRTLCEPVKAPREELDYQHYFCCAPGANEDELLDKEALRLTLYQGYVPITCCMGCPSASCKHALIFTPLP